MLSKKIAYPTISHDVRLNKNMFSSDSHNIKLKIKKVVGAGVYGTVYSGHFYTDNSRSYVADLAIKVNKGEPNLFQTAKHELNVLKLISERRTNGSPHVISLIWGFSYSNTGNNFLGIVTELYTTNCLAVIKHKFGIETCDSTLSNSVIQRLDLADVSDMWGQILSGFRHLDQFLDGHFDFKPENILVKYPTPSFPQTPARLFHVAICDFGASVYKNTLKTHLTFNRCYTSYSHEAPELAIHRRIQDFGTREQLLNFLADDAHVHGLDTWSLGCTLFALVSGRLLFNLDESNSAIKTLNFLTEGYFNRPALTNNSNLKTFQYHLTQAKQVQNSGTLIRHRLPYNTAIRPSNPYSITETQWRYFTDYVGRLFTTGAQRPLPTEIPPLIFPNESGDGTAKLESSWV